jgi:hypothetical protein
MIEDLQEAMQFILDQTRSHGVQKNKQQCLDLVLNLSIRHLQTLRQK